MRVLRRFLAAAPLLAAAACLAGAARAQADWLAKPYAEWSKAEAERVLESPPWAVRQTVKIRYEAQARRVAGAGSTAAGVVVFGSEPELVRPGGAVGGGAEAPVDFVFTLRMRSAPAVRKAVARLAQLEAERLKGKERAALEARAKGLAECPACTDNYVLTLSSKSEQVPGADAVYTIYKGARLDDIKRYIFIANERGERRPLVHFVPPKAPGDEATFFFPRLDERGNPLLTPESRELIFNVTNNEVNAVTNFRVDVSTLVRGGVVEF
ncbi:MAG TPA: hypothetical protein VG148_02325 [Pyrinomonadaceae bacterium]|nr:hypothetical protein [Pyrinomonadaceae bacterium]